MTVWIRPLRAGRATSAPSTVGAVDLRARRLGDVPPDPPPHPPVHRPTHAREIPAGQGSTYARSSQRRCYAHTHGGSLPLPRGHSHATPQPDLQSPVRRDRPRDRRPALPPPRDLRLRHGSDPWHDAAGGIASPALPRGHGARAIATRWAADALPRHRSPRPELQLVLDTTRTLLAYGLVAKAEARYGNWMERKACCGPIFNIGVPDTGIGETRHPAGPVNS